MAFMIRNLSVLAYAQGFTLWHYKAGDARLQDVARHGFFDDAADMLTGGDMVMISARDGGRIACVAPLPDGAQAGGVTLAPLA